MLLFFFCQFTTLLFRARVNIKRRYDGEITSRTPQVACNFLRGDITSPSVPDDTNDACRSRNASACRISRGYSRGTRRSRQIVRGRSCLFSVSTRALRIKASVLELPNDRHLLFRPSLSLAVDDNREFSVTSDRSFPRVPRIGKAICNLSKPRCN